MIDLSTINLQLRDYIDRIQDLEQTLQINQQLSELKDIEEQLQDPNIWQDQQAISELSRRKSIITQTSSSVLNLKNELVTLSELIELAQDEDTLDELTEIIKDLPQQQRQLEQLEIKTLFSGELDSNNCYVEIQAGSGGTEAQDWAEMLFRQYTRWAERHQFKVDILDYSEGEVAGYKSASIHIIGDFAYGWLRTETGIHRLVRKSPFDSSNRRHTSFASVFVSPEIDDSFEIDVNPADIRVDVYRASGAGGQHVNRTESAVRLTHLPTNTVTQCQNSRSQHANKAEAMKQLRAKLYELEIKKRNSEKQLLEDSKADIGWGSQIRSYVLDSGRIKDLRTGVEVGNTQAVLDGDLDIFIEASLKQQGAATYAEANQKNSKKK